MPVSHYEIAKRVTSAVKAVDNSTPTSWPNHELSTYPDGLWLGVFLLRSSSEPVTIGSLGLDEHINIIQIDINYPLMRGQRVLLQKADEFIAAFPAGHSLGYGLVVTSNSLSSPRHIDGYFRISVSINIETQQPRI